MPSDNSDSPRASPLGAEATVELLEAARRGDESALERLFERCVPPLRRWAHGRLPASLRGSLDTVDLVQDAVTAALRRLEHFEPRHQGALQAYLRQSVLNRIRDLARAGQRQPHRVDLSSDPIAAGASPLELAIGAENVERYERALARLASGEREAIIGRLELHYGYDELAIVLDKPSADAARMAVTRAMRRLAEEMRHD